MGKKKWVFTEGRKASLRKARQEHSRLVHVGEAHDKKYKERHGD